MMERGGFRGEGRRSETVKHKANVQDPGIMKWLVRFNKGRERQGQKGADPFPFWCKGRWKLIGKKKVGKETGNPKGVAIHQTQGVSWGM